MRSHSTLLGTALAALGSVTCSAVLAAPPLDVPAPELEEGAPLAQALILAASEAPEIVTIDGKRWREAPPGAAVATGRAGTRIILDGAVWLRAEDPLFDQPVVRDAARPSGGAKPVEPATPAQRAAAPPARSGASRPSAVAPAPVAETPEQLRIRQKRLMAESRRRQAARLGNAPDERAAARATEREAARAARREQQRLREQEASDKARDAEPTSGLQASDDGRQVAETPAELRLRQRQLLREARLRRADSEAAAQARATGLAAARATARARERDAADRAQDIELIARLDRSQRDRERAEAMARDAAAADAVAQQAAGEAAFVQTATVSALRLPNGEPNNGDDFSYVQLMPINYDIGGAGVMVEGSTVVRERMHLLLRAGIADRYQEVLVGAGLHYTPPTADRLTLLLNAGYEYGVFPLEDAATGLQVDDASGGPFLTASGRLVLNPRFMIEGGVGYSSFHEGDPIGFGSGFFHVNDVLDLMSRIELGDQDSYGIGIRVNY